MIALDVLAGLALGDLEGDDEAAAEEHVLSCTPCARILEGMIVAGDALRAMFREARGRGFVHVSESVVALLEEAGLITRRYDLAPGQRAPCTVDPSDRFALTILRADLAGVARVDVEWAGHRVEDVPFERDRGRIVTIASRAELLTLPTMKVPIRVVGLDARGQERTLGEYVLDHTAP